MLTRRGLLGSLISFVAAPAIVRVASIMPVKAIAPTVDEALTYEYVGEPWNELLAVTRKAFVPRLVVQIYFANPALRQLIKPPPNHELLR